MQNVTWRFTFPYFTHIFMISALFLQKKVNMGLHVHLCSDVICLDHLTILLFKAMPELGLYFDHDLPVPADQSAEILQELLSVSGRHHILIIHDL